jgi:ribonuclease P protein component
VSPIPPDPTRDRRLRRPAEFAAVARAPRARSLRAARHWLAMTAAWFPASDSAPSAVRFGTTVARRYARRAVDRALVKRIVREAARAARPVLVQACATRGLRADVELRLKTQRAAARDAEPMRRWRRSLRDEADDLLRQLAQHLASVPIP